MKKLCRGKELISDKSGFLLGAALFGCAVCMAFYMIFGLLYLNGDYSPVSLFGVLIVIIFAVSLMFYFGSVFIFTSLVPVKKEFLMMSDDGYMGDL